MKYNLEDSKTRVKVWIGVVLIPLIIFGFLYYEKHEIKTYSTKILSTISSRNVDNKGNVTIEVYFEYKNLKYRSLEIVTGYEKRKNVILEEGDTVIVEFSYHDPTMNKIILNKKWYD